VSTPQLVIVCVASLLALLAVGFVVIYAVDSRETLAAKQLEAARLADHLGSTVAGELASAVASLEALTDALEGSGALAVPGPSMVGASLVIHTRKPDDQSIRGVVDAHYADRLVLRDAQYLHSSGAQPAGGVVDVLLINVSTWQEIPPPALEAA
jgi:hypothetical protein